VLNQHIPILIFLIPFISAFLIPLFYWNRRLAQGLASGALLLSALCSLRGLVLVSQGETLRYYLGGWIPPYGIEWRLDALSALMALLVTTLAFVVVASTGQSVTREIGTGKIPYYTLVQLHIAGLLGMILTHDLFNLFVFLEVASLTGYALIAAGNSRRGQLASFRYVLIGTIGASFYLLGVGYLYATTGTLNMEDTLRLIASPQESRTVFMALLLIALGLFIKMGLFPFHIWLPNAYAEAPDATSALIAPLMTKVAIYSFIRIFGWATSFGVAEPLHLPVILKTLGALAILAGSLMAFYQSNFKRMLAYSSVSHIGFLMLALGIQQQIAFIGLLLHLVFHAVMKTCLFLIAASAAHQHQVRSIADLQKLRGVMPWTLAFFCMAALSMIGIPPFCGFFGKWYILVGALQAQQMGAAILIVTSSLLSALYFFRLFEKIFFHTAKSKPLVHEGPWPLVWSTGFLSVNLVLLGLFAPKIFQWGLEHIHVPGLF